MARKPSAYAGSTNYLTVENRRSVLLGCCQAAEKKQKRTQGDCDSLADWHHVEVQNPYTPQRQAGLYSHSMPHRNQPAQGASTRLLQSTAFPQAPVPTATIADILELQQMQRFDLMAIAAKILEERKSRTVMNIADVRLVDGSKQETATEYASLPLTLFFKDAAELTTFKNCLGKTPLLFMCLIGSLKDGKVSVATIETQS